MGFWSELELDDDWGGAGSKIVMVTRIGVV